MVTSLLSMIICGISRVTHLKAIVEYAILINLIVTQLIALPIVNS